MRSDIDRGIRDERTEHFGRTRVETHRSSSLDLSVRKIAAVSCWRVQTWVSAESNTRASVRKVVEIGDREQKSCGARKLLLRRPHLRPRRRPSPHPLGSYFPVLTSSVHTPPLTVVHVSSSWFRPSPTFLTPHGPSINVHTPALPPPPAGIILRPTYISSFGRVLTQRSSKAQEGLKNQMGYPRCPHSPGFDHPINSLYFPPRPIRFDFWILSLAPRRR